MSKQIPIDLVIDGVGGEHCQAAINQALELLATKLPGKAVKLLAGTKVTIGSNLTESGGETSAEKKEILLDASKNELSLQEAEDFLVKEGFLDVGDWTSALPKRKNLPWSCLTYQLIHEAGHIFDGQSTGSTYRRLDPRKSPTKYGQKNASEAFAEAFTYWIFGLSLETKTKDIVTTTLNEQSA
jgi:hypothetical protein